MNAWLIALLSLLALATLLTAAYIWTIRPPTPYTEEEARSGIHYNTMKQLVSSLPQTFHDRSKTLLFYGAGSQRATRIAQDLGYTRVGYLVQGSYKGFEHRDPPIRHEM